MDLVYPKLNYDLLAEIDGPLVLRLNYDWLADIDGPLVLRLNYDLLGVGVGGVWGGVGVCWVGVGGVGVTLPRRPSILGLDGLP